MANNQLLASDSFSSGSLAAGWSAVNGLSVCQVTGTPKVTEPNALSTEAGQIWTGLTWPKDHASEVTVNLTSEASSYIFPCVRLQSGAYSGYRANIVNGTAGLYRMDNGSATGIGSIVAGLTFAPGDIWCLQAAGACISLYQNFKLIIWHYDATYTTGSPGFTQYSTSNIAHTQVASWRGYNAVQQDGIWTKQGIVMPAIAGELASNGSGTQNPRIIFEGNAQILSGNVYKMWFVSGNASAFALSYAESLDGLNWTRYSSNPVIASVGLTTTVFKNASTYYAYSSFLGSGAGVTLYTSSDGLAWTSQGTVFAGVTGKQITYFGPLAVVAGTWYATYFYNVATFPQQTRLATSPDGVTWTDYASNPVVNNFWGLIRARQVGSNWYVWGQTTNPNAQETTFPGTDPGEGLRMQTTDFINWTNPVHSVHHSQQFEDVNDVNGGCYLSFAINVNGRAYVYYTASTDDTGAGGLLSVYQIGAASGPASILSVVTQNEDAISQVATDGFTSGAGNLDGNWTTPSGGTALQIVSGPYVEPTVATGAWCQAVYTGAAFSSNQYSEVAIHALTGTEYFSAIEPRVRCSTTALTDYEGYIAGPTAVLGAKATIYKRVADTATQIGPLVACTPTVGDVWRLSVIDGNDGFPVLSLFQNGYLIVQAQDQSATPILTGNPGMAAESLTAIADAQIASWAGGNANVIPHYKSGKRSTRSK